MFLVLQALHKITTCTHFPEVQSLETAFAWSISASHLRPHSALRDSRRLTIFVNTMFFHTIVRCMLSGIEPLNTVVSPLSRECANRTEPRQMSGWLLHSGPKSLGHAHPIAKAVLRVHHDIVICTATGDPTSSSMNIS